MATVTRNLQFKDGRHYARLAVPKEVQPALDNRRELVTALGADRAAALDRLPAALVAMKSEIALARSTLAESAKPRRAQSPARQLTPVEIGHQHLQDRLTLDEMARNSGSPLVGVGFPDERYVQQLRDIVAGRLIDPLPALLGDVFDEVRGNSPLKDERATLRALARAELVYLDAAMHLDEGLAPPPIPAELIPPKREDITPAQNPRIIGRDSTKPLSELLETFAAEKGARPGTQNEYRVAVRMFEEFLAEPLPAFAITRQHVVDYKNALTRTPSNYAKRFPGKGIREAIKENGERKAPYPALNHVTINDKWLPRLHSLLSWCVNNGVIPDNPASGVRVDVAKGTATRSRKPFTPDDLTRIFKERVADPERRWAMLIALHTGMRASEIAQLKLDSVRHARRILSFEVEEETKNGSSVRVVPLHSTLIALGIEEHIAKLREAGKDRLFPNWYAEGVRKKQSSKRSINQPFASILPRWFNRTYLPGVGIHDSTKVFHSFRHTLKSALARAGVSRHISDEITGHDDSSSGAGYIHDAPVEAMKEALESVIFDGFDPAKLKNELARSG